MRVRRGIQGLWDNSEDWYLSKDVTQHSLGVLPVQLHRSGWGSPWQGWSLAK